MRKSIRSLLRALPGVLMTLLGFSSCNAVKERFEPRFEYGVPSADYMLMGSAKDERGVPIKGIRVVFHPHTPKTDPEISDHETDTLYTDANGVFRKDVLRYRWPELSQATVTFDDVDGESNGGEFKSLQLGPDKLDVRQLKGGGRWYRGSFLINAEAELKLKKGE